MPRWIPFTLCLTWIGLAFWMMALPPVTPDPRTGPRTHLIPPRPVYDPELAAFLDEGRDYWQKPKEVLELLGDLEGLTVADIGCGEGYFTLPLLEAVGPAGKVIGTDIQETVLTRLEQRVDRKLRDRLELILSAPDHTGIHEQVDLILLVQVLAEVDEQRAFLKMLTEIMHEGTHLVLIDSKHVTDPVNGFTQPLNLKILAEGLRAVGLVFADEFEMERFQILPKQFFFVLRKQSFK